MLAQSQPSRHAGLGALESDLNNGATDPAPGKFRRTAQKPLIAFRPSAPPRDPASRTPGRNAVGIASASLSDRDHRLWQLLQGQCTIARRAACSEPADCPSRNRTPLRAPRADLARSRADRGWTSALSTRSDHSAAGRPGANRSAWREGTGRLRDPRPTDKRHDDFGAAAPSSHSGGSARRSPEAGGKPFGPPARNAAQWAPRLRDPLPRHRRQRDNGREDCGGRPVRGLRHRERELGGFSEGACGCSARDSKPPPPNARPCRRSVPVARRPAEHCGGSGFFAYTPRHSGVGIRQCDSSSIGARRAQRRGSNSMLG